MIYILENKFRDRPDDVSRYCRDFKHNRNLEISIDDVRSDSIYDLELRIDNRNVEIILQGRVVSEIINAVIRQTSNRHFIAIATGVDERLDTIKGAKQRLARNRQDETL